MIKGDSSLPSMLVLVRRSNSQSTKREYSENNELLRSLNLQLLNVRHGEDEYNEIQSKVGGFGANEEQSIIHVASSILYALVPIARHRDAMQDDSNILIRHIINWFM
jgi:hypothetical protein